MRVTEQWQGCGQEAYKQQKLRPDTVRQQKKKKVIEEVKRWEKEAGEKEEA